MSTPPISATVPLIESPVSTPAVTLPCGVKVPSIPLIPTLSFSVTIPAFNFFPVKKPKKGAKPSRQGTKLVARAQKLAKMCNSALPVPRT